MSRETTQHFHPIPASALRELRDMSRPLCTLSRATLEARVVELEGFRARVADTIGIPSEASDDQIIAAIDALL